MADNWINGAVKNPGSLRSAMHIKEGETIPQGRLHQAAHSNNPTMAKRANLALTLKKLHARHGGKI